MILQNPQGGKLLDMLLLACGPPTFYVVLITRANLRLALSTSLEMPCPMSLCLSCYCFLCLNPFPFLHLLFTQQIPIHSLKSTQPSSPSQEPPCSLITWDLSAIVVANDASLHLLRTYFMSVHGKSECLHSLLLTIGAQRGQVTNSAISTLSLFSCYLVHCTRRRRHRLLLSLYLQTREQHGTPYGCFIRAGWSFSWNRRPISSTIPLPPFYINYFMPRLK